MAALFTAPRWNLFLFALLLTPSSFAAEWLVVEDVFHTRTRHLTFRLRHGAPLAVNMEQERHRAVA